MKSSMNTQRWRMVFLIGSCWIFVTGMALAEEKGGMRDAATHEELSKRLLIDQKNDPMKQMRPASNDQDPSMVNPPRDFISQSDILCFGGYATFVPKRAVIQKPQKLADRFALAKNCKIISWPAFMQLNRGWITTLEVSRSQAEGKMPFSEEVQKMMEKSTNVVVATYQGGPISVLPLQVQPAEKGGKP